MNETFNFRRFGKYFFSDLTRLFSENWLRILCFGLIPVFALLLSMLLSMFRWEEYNYIGAGKREFLWAVATGLFTVTFPAACYGYVADKRAGSHFALVPASGLEKTVSMIINTGIIVPAIYLTLYLTADLISTLAAGAGMEQTLLKTNYFLMNSTWMFRDILNWNMLISLHVSMLFFLLGAIFFRKGRITKTILISFALGIIGLLLINTGLRIMDNIDPADKMWLTSRGVGTWTTITLVVESIVLYVLIYFRTRKIQY